MASTLTAFCSLFDDQFATAMYDHDAKSSSYDADSQYDMKWGDPLDTTVYADPFAVPAPPVSSTFATTSASASSQYGQSQGHVPGSARGQVHGDMSEAGSACSEAYTEEWEALPSPSPRTAAASSGGGGGGWGTEGGFYPADSSQADQGGSLCEGSPYSYPYRTNSDRGPTGSATLGSSGGQCGECSNLLNQLGETLDILEKTQREASECRQQLDIMRGNLDLLASVEDCEHIERELVNSLRMIKDHKVCGCLIASYE
jgi:hypothetical protein